MSKESITVVDRDEKDDLSFVPRGMAPGQKESESAINSGRSFRINVGGVTETCITTWNRCTDIVRFGASTGPVRDFFGTPWIIFKFD